MANPRTIARLEARIKERAAYCLQFELKDPRGAMITITRVELAQDLRNGKIHYSCLGDEAEKLRAQRLLESAAGFIQRQVARVLDTRNVPHLEWVFDDSIERAARLDDLIREARERDEAIRPEADEVEADEVEADEVEAGEEPPTEA